MNITVKGIDCSGNAFTQENLFTLHRPKEGESYYGTGCYMSVVQTSEEYGKQDHLVDVRYRRTTDLEKLADEWIADFFGKNAREIIKH